MHAQLGGAHKAGDKAVNILCVFTQCGQLIPCLQILCKQGQPPLVNIRNIWCGLEVFFEQTDIASQRIKLSVKLDVQEV